jgi:predicted ATPase
VTHDGNGITAVTRRPDEAGFLRRGTYNSSMLPSPTTTFVGRHDDLWTIGSWFGAGHRLVVIVGPPGMGKTRTAIEYAASVTDREVRFCDLTEVRDLDGVCAHLAVALGLRLEPGADVAASIGLALHEGRYLLVLDNFEQLVDSCAAAVSRWLARAPTTQILVTTRERLAIAGEVVHELDPLAGLDAVELFVDRARQLRRDFALTTADTPVVAEIVRRLDGIPLAIEVAAARMDVMAPATLVERLHRHLGVLAGGRRDASARQATLRGAIDDSWTALTPAARTALAQVAVFRGGFTLEAAEAVIDLAAIPDAPAIVDVLATLRAKSLVRVHGGVRFSLYESIRDYAFDKLVATGELTQARIRHARYYVCRYASGERRTVRDIAIERDNLIAIVENALAYPAAAEPTRVAMEVLLAIDPVLPRSGPSDAHLGWLDAVLARPAELVDPRLRTNVMLARGRALLARGRFEASLRGFDDALASARVLDDTRLEARALMGIAVSHQRRHHDIPAKPVFERALELLDATDLRRICVVRGYLGEIEQQAGRLTTARAQFDEALRLVESSQLSDRAYLESTVRLRLAFLALDEGNPAEAQYECEQVMALAVSVRSRRLQGLSDGCLALASWFHGRLDEADELIARSLQALGSAGDQANTGFALSISGAIHAARDRIDDSMAAFAAADAALADIDDQVGTATAAIYRGHLDLARARTATGETARSYRAEAERRLDLDAVGAHASQARVAVRTLQRALAEVASPAARDDDVLVVDHGERQIRIPGRVRWVRFGRQAVLWRLLIELCDARLRAPGQPISHDALFAAGWPGQSIAPASAQNRLHVALNSLRKLGLRPLVITRDDGYMLTPSVRVRWAAS